MSGLAQQVTGWFNAGLSFVFPEACQLCNQQRATPAEGFVCEHCRARVRFIEPPFCERCGLPHEGAITTQFECANCRDLSPHYSFARSSVVARDQVLDVIHRYKYHRAFWFEPFLAELLARRAVPHLARERWDLILPVPLHRTKLREREFNQAERLARRLSRASGIPLDSDALKRVVATRTQTLLSREERLVNVRQAFSVAKGRALARQRIVLVDDVFTTGATTSACARILREAGASEVCVWTVARGT
jgi:ComF family protein